MNKKNLKVLIKSDEIKKGIKKYSKILNDKLKKNKDIVFLCVLNGVTIFITDLFREINKKIKFEIEFISVYSYQGKESSNLNVKKWISNDITGKYLIIIEDVIDTGKTITNIIQKLNKENKPRKIDILSLVSKKEAHPNFKYKYDSIFYIENKFIVGYGFDFDEKYRNLKDICIYEN